MGDESPPGWCPTCERVVERSEIIETKDRFGEHKECGDDLLLAERVVVGLLEGALHPDA
jgi:hypothetical protein